MPTIDEMVERLKVDAWEPVALADAVADLYGEEVYVHHVPPMPADGPKKGSEVVALHRTETDIWMKNIPDYHHEDVEVWADGSELHLKVTLAGTIEDKRFAVPTHWILKVADGVINDASLEADREATKPMMDLVMRSEVPVDVIWDPYA